MAKTLPRRRLSLLASSSLVVTSLVAGVGAFGVATFAPGEALAACAGENTASVVCDAVTPATAGTVVTTYVNAVPNISASVRVNAGAAINAGGLTVTQTGVVGELLVYVDDPAGISSAAGTGVSVTNTTGGRTTFNNQGGIVIGSGGDGIYVSTGAAALPTTSVNITTGEVVAAGAGVQAISSGAIGVDVNGTILAGLSGVTAQGNGDGNVSVGVGANIVSLGAGVVASNSSTGDVTITSQAGTLIRGDSNYGVVGQSTDGDVTIVINGDVGASVNPTGFDAVLGQSLGAGNVSVTANGDIYGGFAGVQAITSGTGSVYVEYGNDAGDSITASSAAIGTYINNGGSTASATAVVNSGATLNANSGVISRTAGSGTATASLFNNVTINGAINGVSVSSGTGDATVSIASGLSITLADVFAGVNSEGIYAESGRSADAAVGDEAIEISVDQNATIFINAIGLDSDSSAGISALATGATGGIDIDVGNDLNFVLLGTNTQGIAAQTVGGSINITTGRGSINLAALDTADAIGDFSSANGIGATSASGSITIDSATNISVLMADASATGINAQTGGAGAVSVTSSGTILSSGAGISTSTASGANIIVNNGAVTANGGNGLFAFSGAGNINIANTADITSAFTGIGALNAGAAANGSIVVNSYSGAITAGGDGINVSNVGAGNAGLIYVQNVGTITANTAGIGGFGIYAQQAGDGEVIIQSVGAIAGTAQTGIFVAGNGTTGMVSIAANGGGIGSAVDSVTSTGIGAYQYNAAGAGGISVLANGFAGIYAGQFGIDARNLGAGTVRVNVVASNPIVTSGVGSVAINSQAGIGATDIDVASAITSGGVGINAVSGDGGISIDTTAGGTINAADDGIFASSTGGNVVVTTAGAVTALNGDGVQVQATGAGSAVIINSATITSGRHGLYAFSQTSSVNIANSGAITANTTGGAFAGILGSSNNGPVTIVLNGGTSIAGTVRDGVVAQTGFGGDVIVAGNGAVTIGTAGDFTEGVGIRAEALGLSDGHDATVFLQAPTSIFAVNGGINANASGVGAVNLLLSGNSSITTSGATSYGIRAASGGGSIQVAAPLSANITSAGSGIVTVNSGAGSTTVAASGNVTASGVGLAGISATSGTGATVISAGNGITIAGTAGSGIRTNAAGAVVTVNVGTGGVGAGSTLVTGLGAGANGWVVDLNNAAGGTSTLNVASNGVIRSADATTGGYDDLAIRGIGGALAINNGGRINGVVNAAGATSLVFNNSSLNSWHTTGTSTFSAGADTLNNTGAIFTGAGGAATTIDFGAGADTFANSGLLVAGEPTLAASTLTLTGLESWNNSGRIVFGSSGTSLNALSDGQINDRILAAGTTFTGSGASRLVMDASLGATVQTGCAVLTAADCLGLTGGSTAGATQILVNDIGGSASGALNTTGIVLVDVTGAGATAASNFALDPTSAGWRADANSADGVIDKGLFFYDLVLDGKQHKLVGLPDADVFEFSTIGTAAQSAWYTTTGVWLDRQADLRQQLEGIDGSGAGVWMKIAGSAATRDRTSSYDVLGTTYSFDTSYDQNTVALIGGLDFMGGGSGKAWVIGGQIGYVDSDVSYDASSTVTSLEGMTLGLYGTYVSGSFFVDGIVNANMLDYDHQNVTLAPAGSNVFSGEINSLGFQVEGGWTVPLGANGFFEPLASVSYLNTDIDAATVPGSVINWDDQTSLRASLGGRLGLDADHGTFSSQWAITARYWNEFEGDNGLTVDSGGADLDINDDFSGSFGELGVSVNLFGADDRFSAFLNIGTKFNDDYTSAEGSLGLRWRW